MKVLKAGSLWENPDPDDAEVAAHTVKLPSGASYSTTLYMDRVRGIVIENEGEKAYTAFKIRGYKGWYLGRWDQDDIQIVSGPYEKLSVALVVQKMETPYGV